MRNSERVEKLVLGFIDKMGLEKPMEGSYELWEEINKDPLAIEGLLELGYIGLFVSTLDACVALCLLENDMVGVENVDEERAREHMNFRSGELDLRLRELVVKIFRERIEGKK